MKWRVAINENEAIEEFKQRLELIEKCYRGEVEDYKQALELGVKALEKQMPKKPIMKPYFDDMEEEYLCCPTCGEILTDRIPLDNKDFYFHCLNCGQKFNWESDEE